MAWRDFFLENIAPGLLGGVTFGDWFKLLRDNGFRVSPSCWFRAMGITSQSMQNSLVSRWEDWRYGDKIRFAEIFPPIFVLGHWRSGTTHLHNLLTLDTRFAFPNIYQVLYPYTFLSTEAAAAGMLSFFMTKRRPMDNIEWNIRSPQEDEFALCVATGMSSYLGWVFPRRIDHYQKYLTLRGASEDEIAQWKAALAWFLKKLTWKYGKPLVLKSPTHTCRVKVLLEMFPAAKFVHIRRDPYAVFQSTRRMYQTNFRVLRLQSPALSDLDDRLIKQYQEVHDAFFEEVPLIPEKQFHELGFEELEANPIGQMERLYEALSLPNFCEVEPELRRYVESIAGYAKNEFSEMPADLKRKVAQEWKPCFERWGYAM